MSFDPASARALPEFFHPCVRRWFSATFNAPTPAQLRTWPLIARRDSTLLMAPTGSGKTLAAFLVAINRLMFDGATETAPMTGTRVLYLSPLKALGVDVERNLRAPLCGIEREAEQTHARYRLPGVGIRTGDTPAAERRSLAKQPPDILITTPESLFLMLTSRIRATLCCVDTVIVDEIHVLSGSKRGAHLAVSLERLEDLRRAALGKLYQPMQRIGLSATQRPLHEVAKFLGGMELDKHLQPIPRPVEIVAVDQRKALELRIEMPPREASPPDGGLSLWPAIHKRIVELLRERRTTLIFVNSRRLAERLAAAINELAQAEIALAHHGSIAKETRIDIEERLKRGELAAIVATSSLELGIDMGSVDLVIQIEAPLSIASGLQRIGRSGHAIDARASGVLLPKYRGDLLAAAAATRMMLDGEVEETHYPRNPLDVLSQQLVAMAALEPLSVDQAYRIIRQAAPFSELARGAFENVLDLLSGRYAAERLFELKPRITWDRNQNMLFPRSGTQRLAILNAGTIPDRGLYGVYLFEQGGTAAKRVGELDEEMVFEIHPGDVFLLGVSSWRVVEITRDRVLVAPAPGEPGRMPFWRGDGSGRGLAFGRAIGRLTRRLSQVGDAEALDQLVGEHCLDEGAARQLIAYVRQQQEATGALPSDTTVLVEIGLDDAGGWRVAILTPFGRCIHAPWAIALMPRLRAGTAADIDMVWSDDGIMLRLPAAAEPPPVQQFFPGAGEAEEILMRELGATALFAARFRENAARALLLPKRLPGRRMPLWLQRRRAADLLAEAVRLDNFPIILETYRECLRDDFDLSGLREILDGIGHKTIRVHAVQRRAPSPFTASLLQDYIGDFVYGNDAPAAERRARTLALDAAQLRELMGAAELRKLFDDGVVQAFSAALQCLQGHRASGPDDAHDLLLRLGDLSEPELLQRCGDAVTATELRQWLDSLLQHRRIIAIELAGEARYAAAEDTARLRDALGVNPPPGVAAAFLEGVADPLGDLVARYARTHVPFTVQALASRFGLGAGPVPGALQRLQDEGRVVEGEFLPCGAGTEWCDTENLRVLKRRSLARLRRQIEPAAPTRFVRFLLHWHNLSPRAGPDALMAAVTKLQGAALPFSALQRDILPARVKDYRAEDLDQLLATGEILWQGRERLGADDGRIALYLAGEFRRLGQPPAPVAGKWQGELRQLLAARGALFFADIVARLGGFPDELLKALWDLVWSGEVSNDTFAPLHSLRRRRPGRRRARIKRFRGFTEIRHGPPGSEGRWSLLARPDTGFVSPTERQTALVEQLLQRYGIVCPECAESENIPGGFAGMYPVLRAMEESGKVRRGYFVEGLGAMQFALPGADELMRRQGAGGVIILGAVDPANPYGSLLPWPAGAGETARPQRVAGARVILRDGVLLAYLGRTGQVLLSFLPDDEYGDAALDALIAALQTLAQPNAPLVLTSIDGGAPEQSSLAGALRAAGFRASSQEYLYRVK